MHTITIEPWDALLLRRSPLTGRDVHRGNAVHTFWRLYPEHTQPSLIPTGWVHVAGIGYLVPQDPKESMFITHMVGVFHGQTEDNRRLEPEGYEGLFRKAGGSWILVAILPHGAFCTCGKHPYDTGWGRRPEGEENR